MEKSMRELLERSFEDDKVIAYIEELEKANTVLTRNNNALQKQVDKLAEKLADVSDCTTCEKACPIGNSEDCDCECFDENVWKEWAKKDE